MTTDVMDHRGVFRDVEAATERLVAATATLTEDDIRAPSLLAGWTRGHVFTHLARNADGLCNLLAWASTGTTTPMYASREARDADIAAGAGRPVAEIVADLRESASRFARAVVEVPDTAWTNQVANMSGELFPAAKVPWLRLKEVEIHHVDLDEGYSPAHWPADFVTGAVDDVIRSFTARTDVPALTLRVEADDETDSGERLFRLTDQPDQPVVSGPGRALLAWLTGRSRGDGLVVEPPGPLPALPRWL